ncbi:hypothetical protein MnTg04_00380 [bacterium MnTg04]|nr:hypothetical protein MnTg04_00380 [bacterium MnTg04]
MIPFASRGGGSEGESFAEGIHDDLLTHWNVLASPIFETIRGNPEYRDIFAAIESHLAQQRDLYLASLK